MKNKKGFTLIELLAVIVILGVLLLIAVPAITGIQRTSKQKAAKDGALMFLKAVEMCNSMSETGNCDSSALQTYYEGTIADSVCSTTDTDDCVSYVIDETSGNIKIVYRLGGYGVYNNNEKTVLELKKAVSDVDTDTLTSNTKLD